MPVFQDIQPDWITFRMVTKKEMSSALSENAAGMHTGVSIMDQLIWVLDHSNKIAIAATLAHEILHSWQMKKPAGPTTATIQNRNTPCAYARDSPRWARG